eukprot:10468383-Ditylum_brightwellii.AAC.1
MLHAQTCDGNRRHRRWGASSDSTHPCKTGVLHWDLGIFRHLDRGSPPWLMASGSSALLMNSTTVNQWVHPWRSWCYAGRLQIEKVSTV